MKMNIEYRLTPARLWRGILILEARFYFNIRRFTPQADRLLIGGLTAGVSSEFKRNKK